MALICISLMMSDAEHLFVYLLAICKLDFRKYPFSSSVYSILKSLFFVIELYEFSAYFGH